MAGPFDPVQQAGIREERLSQSELPASAAEAGAGVAQAVGQAVGTAVKLNTEAVTKEKKDALNRQFDAVGRALSASRGDADDVAELEAAAASGDPFFRGALEEFRTIQDAIKQGKLPSDAATIRMRAILKKATAASPEFSEELRGAARQHLGFAPIAERFRRDLREPSAGPQTATQKRRAEYEAGVDEIMRVTGKDRDTAISVMNQRIRTKNAADLATAEMQVGTYNSGKAVRLINQRGSEITLEMMGVINSQMQSNGGVYDVQSAKTLANTLIARMEIEALSGVTDPKVSGDLRKQIGDLRNSMGRMLDEAGTGKRAGKLFESMVNMTKQNAFVEYPEMRAYMALGDPSGFFTAVDTAAKFANNPEIMQSLGIGSGDRLMMQIGAGTPVPQVFMQSALRFENGEAPVSSGDAKMQAVYAQDKLKDETGTSTSRLAALSKVAEDSGEFTAITMLDNAEVIARSTTDGKFASRVGTLIATNLTGSTARINQAVQAVPNASVSVDPSGTMTVSGIPAPFETVRGQQDAVTELNNAVSQYNRVNDINNKYVSAGVTTTFEFNQDEPAPAAQETPTQFNTDITEQATAAGFAPTEDGIYADSNGNRIEVRDGRIFTTGE